MKKIKIYSVGQKFEIEIEDEFYEYIKDDIVKLNNSTSQIKDLLNLILKERYISYENDKKMKKIIKRLEK